MRPREPGRGLLQAWDGQDSLRDSRHQPVNIVALTGGLFLAGVATSYKLAARPFPALSVLTPCE